MRIDLACILPPSVVVFFLSDARDWSRPHRRAAQNTCNFLNEKRCLRRAREFSLRALKISIASARMMV
jgi:hypothetical protein